MAKEPTKGSQQSAAAKLKYAAATVHTYEILWARRRGGRIGPIREDGCFRQTVCDHRDR